MAIRTKLKQEARRLKNELSALYLAYRDPRVPWYARVLAACVVAYALSPLDLIPDPIPLLGYLDDLLLVPLGIVLVLKMIPPGVMEECRAQAQTLVRSGRPNNNLGSRIAAAMIVLIWMVLGGLICRWLWHWLHP